VWFDIFSFLESHYKDKYNCSVTVSCSALSYFTLTQGGVIEKRGILCILLSCEEVTMMGFRLEIGYIHHFNTQFVTTFNYSAMADLHTSQNTVAHAKFFSLLCVHQSFPGNGF
jgi:hypothetical protein